MLRSIQRLILIVVVLTIIALVAGVVWLATHRDDARTWRQVTAIGAQLGDLGWIDPIGEALSVDTSIARTEQVGTLPATLVTPDDGDENHPAIVLLVPEGTIGSEERRVRDVQHAIAGASMSAWAMRVPADDHALVDPTAPDRLVDALSAIVAHETTRDRHLSVIAVGPTASLVLVAAAEGPVASDLAAIVAVQPIADVRALVALASTGAYVDAAGRQHRADPSPQLRGSAGRAVLQAVRAGLPERDPVLDSMLDAAERSPDPLASLKVLPDAVAGPELAPVLAVLRADTPAEFDAAWARLPAGFRDAAQERSPLPGAGTVRARVLVVQATDDEWARSDVERLAAALPDARTLQVDATDPGAVIDDAAAIREILSVSGWWMRRAGA